MLSVYVVCWIFLQTFQIYFCVQANSLDPDQTAPWGAVWSGSTMFAKIIFKITSRWQSRWQLVIGSLRVKRQKGVQIGGSRKLFLLFLRENICCGYSSEVPQWLLMSTHNICFWGTSNEYPQHVFKALLMSTHNICFWGTSNEYPQHMFSWRNKKNSFLTPLLSEAMIKYS